MLLKKIEKWQIPQGMHDHIAKPIDVKKVEEVIISGSNKNIFNKKKKGVIYLKSHILLFFRYIH